MGGVKMGGEVGGGGKFGEGEGGEGEGAGWRVGRFGRGGREFDCHWSVDGCCGLREMLL